MKNIVPLFLRKETNGAVIKEIDGLRFIAIVAVVLSHFNLQVIKLSPYETDFVYSNALALFLELGGYGVRIFFCISAFILSIPFIQYLLYKQEKVNLKKYYVRRLKRLEIPYLLVLIILLLFRIFVQGEFWKEELPHFFSSVFYSHNIIYDRRSTINPVAWTLEIEIQFYLLLPLLLKLFIIKNVSLRRILLIASICITGIIYAIFENFFIAAHLQYSIVPYFPVFLLGILLADIYLSNASILKEKSFLWDVLGVVGFLFIIYFAGYPIFYKQCIEYIGYVLLFTGVFKGIVLNNIFTKKIIMAIGCMCYSIYLLHYALIAFIAQHITTSLFQFHYYKDLIIQGIIVLPLVLLVCSIFYLLVEKPLIKRR
ncbi:MAG: acyltransferase [Chitinophagaceae bacterium]|nr:acyltransferase [Chitinophagaceae bacterium]MCW5905516.1 acyltransferase [Chitinophagaceae bacterium]